MCKLENGSGCSPHNGGGYLFPPSSAYDAAFMKTEMIQIPHLSSTNSPESLQMSGGESTSSTAKSWPNSLLASRPLLSSKRYFDLTLTLHLKSNLNCQWDFIFVSLQFTSNALLPFHRPLQHGPHQREIPTSRQPQFDSLGDAGEPRRQGSPPAGIPRHRGPNSTPPSWTDRLWRENLYTLLHSQTYNQCEVDLFELLSKVLDQCLFAQVDWARNSAFFKDLKGKKGMGILGAHYIGCLDLLWVSDSRMVGWIPRNGPCLIANGLNDLCLSQRDRAH